MTNKRREFGVVGGPEGNRKCHCKENEIGGRDGGLCKVKLTVIES